LNRKGQSYLIVAFMLVLLMSSIAFISRTTAHQRTEGHFLMENIETELPLAYTSGEYRSDLDNTMTEISNEFNDFANEKNFQLRLVFAAQNQIGAAKHYIVGNWSGDDCTYYNTKKSPVAISNESTASFPRAWLQSDFNLIVCGRTLDLTQDFSYRAEVVRRGEVIVNG